MLSAMRKENPALDDPGQNPGADPGSGVERSTAEVMDLESLRSHEREGVTGSLPPAASHQVGHLITSQREDGAVWEVGSGAIGTIYKAFDPTRRENVALKIIDPVYFPNQNVLDDFLREAGAAKAVSHPNAATVFECGYCDGRTFYATEYVEGEAVERRVQREGPLHPLLALRVARQVVRALVAIEQQKLLHGDVKPSNLLLVTSSSESELAVKLTDTGLARSLRIAGTYSEPSRFAEFVANPQFASPELLEEKAVDVRSDIYSLGASLWFMLTGRPPFGGAGTSLVYQHLCQRLPEDVLLRFPPGVRVLLEKMLAKNPEDRFQTPIELKLELDQQIAELKDQAPAFVGTSGVNPVEQNLNETAFAAGQLIRSRYSILSGPVPNRTMVKALDLQLNQTVALRSLSLVGLPDPRQLGSLHQDIMRLGQLRHPNLLQLISLESYEYGLFIVSEWVNGFSLGELIRSKNSLSWEEALLIFKPLAGLVDFVAEQQLLGKRLSLDQVFVDVPREFSEIDLERAPISGWPPFVVKLDAASLGQTLGRQVVGSDRVDPERNLPEEQPSQIQGFSLLIYEMLGGRVESLGTGESLGELPLLPGLSEEGNRLLRLGITEPNSFANANDLVRNLESKELEQRSGKCPPVSQSAKPLTGARKRRDRQDRSAKPWRDRWRIFVWVLMLLAAAFFLMKYYRDQGRPLAIKSPEAFTGANQPILAVAPAAQVGGLFLSSDPPGLAVEVGNDHQELKSGLTPISFEDLPVGKYRITMKRTGWPDYQQEVKVLPNASVMVEHAFKPVNVTLESDPPGASIFKGDVELGKTPLTISLPPEPVELMSRIGTLTAVTHFVPDSTGSAFALFAHRYGSLYIDSNRLDAQVTVNGIQVGSAPVELDLPPGAQEVIVRASGMEDRTQTVEIRDGQRLVLDMDFTAPEPVSTPEPVSPPEAEALSESTPSPSPAAPKKAVAALDQPNISKHATAERKKKEQHTKSTETNVKPSFASKEDYDRARNNAFGQFNGQWDAKRTELKAQKDWFDYQVQHSTGSAQSIWKLRAWKLNQALDAYDSRRRAATAALNQLWDDRRRDVKN